ncbi:MAG: hypothetical protein AAFO88_04175 [Pseudomonadota bacterium]
MKALLLFLAVLVVGPSLLKTAEAQPVLDLPDQLSEHLDLRDDGTFYLTACAGALEDVTGSNFDHAAAKFRCYRAFAQGAHAVLGHGEMPAAPDARPNVGDPTDYLRGMRVFRPQQDSALVGLWSVALTIDNETDTWTLSSRPLAVHQFPDRADDAANRTCGSERILSEGEKRLIWQLARPVFGAAPLASREGLCIDGAASFIEIASVDRGGQTVVNEYLRECGSRDGVSVLAASVLALSGRGTGSTRGCTMDGWGQAQ